MDIISYNCIWYSDNVLEFNMKGFNKLKPKKKENSNKPIIETIINSTALTLTALGVIQIQNDNYLGFVCITFGVGLEFFKYWGRKINYW